MPCEISDRDRRIDDFLMNQLTPADAEAFEIHLFGCKECLAELRLREQMIEVIKHDSVAAVVEPFPSRRSGTLNNFVHSIAGHFIVSPRAWIYAGVAAMLMIAVFVSALLRDNGTGENDTTNFAPSPRLESLMRQAQRSSELDVAVASPGNAENFSSGDVLFRWQIKKSGQDVDPTMELKILNNQEKLMHSAKIAGNEYYLREKLVPGLYYWTLEYEGESLYLGKFFLSKPTH